MLMDVETIKIAYRLGMAQTRCAACREMTLFIANKQRTNTPNTCGRMSCGVRAGEPWARPVDGTRWE
jgi:hypothetical protein